MRRGRLWLLLALLVLTAFAGGRYMLAATPPAVPPGQRLVDLLPYAVETPSAPARHVWLHLDGLSAPGPKPVAVFAPLEAGRPFVVRMRLRQLDGRSASAELRSLTREQAAPYERGPTAVEGTAPGTLLGPCLVMDDPNAAGAHYCQRSEELGGDQAGVLIVVSNPDVGVEALEVMDTSLPDMREPASPLLGPLVRRWYAKTPFGTRGMTGLAAPPEGQYVFDVVLPSKPALRLSIRHEPGVHAAPMQFEVLQDGRTLFSEVVAPGRQFHDYEWPLSGTPGQHTRLTLSARPASGSSGEYRGLWMNPRVVGASQAPNILFVSIDALRTDHLSAYGYARDTTPNLKKLLSVGARFDRATAQAGTTWESVTSFLTGLYPVHNGVRARGRFPTAGVEQLADRLSAGGYATFAGAHTADFPSEMMTAFDEDEFLDRNMKEAQVNHDLPPALLAQQTAGVLKRAGEHPFFLWLHVDQPHYPLLPGKPDLFDPGYQGRFADRFALPDHAAETVESLTPAEAKHLTALYDAAIHDADEGLGAVLGVLSEAGVLQNTIVVVTADHGEAIGERGIVLDHTVPFDSVLHVPLVIAWPGTLAPRASVPDRVQLVDVMPTLLSLAELPVPVGLDGRDLSPLLKGGSLSPLPAFSEVTDVFSRYDGDQHFIYNPRHFRLGYGYRPSSVPIADAELYDLARDPGEHSNLALADPGRTAALAETLRRELGDWLEPGGSDSRAGMTQDVLDALTQAGYLQAPAKAAAKE